MRWLNPERGLVPPGEFIPVLEKNGFVGNVDKCVWDLACKSIHDCIEKGITPVPISINVSRIDILSFDVRAYLDSLIEKYGFGKELLKIEITESAYTDNSSKVNNAVQELRMAGYALMMDDFGSGYSSLNMLRDVSVDVLKLDMRFLDIERGDMKKGIGILKSIINMANEINVPIVMEGVETDFQSDFLMDLGVRYAQGYRYHKPMPLADFEKLISNPDNVDTRFIYNQNIDVEKLNAVIDEILSRRNDRYAQMEISKIRGGFITYKNDESQQLIHVSSSVPKMYGCKNMQEFLNYVGNSFMGMVHPEDRERVDLEIKRQIKDSDWKMDYIEYRMIRKDGRIRYMNDYGHLEGEEGQSDSYFYAFILDITDRLEKDI